MGILDFIRNRKNSNNLTEDKSKSGEGINKDSNLFEDDFIEFAMDEDIALDGEMIKVLQKATEDLFSDSPQLLLNNLDVPDAIMRRYLCYHTRDEKWLAMMLAMLTPQTRYFPRGVIRKYVEKSKFLEIHRHKYELEMVKSLIKIISNDLYIKTSKDRPLEFLFDTDRVSSFREKIMTTLLSIGIDKEVIEEGLETFADMWRQNQMELSCDQVYLPNLPFGFDNKEVSYDYDSFKSAWISLSEYEYYQKYKDSVDKYGSKTADMDMTAEEAQKLKRIVVEKYKKRKDYIAKVRKSNYMPNCSSDSTSDWNRFML